MEFDSLNSPRRGDKHLYRGEGEALLTHSGGEYVSHARGQTFSNSGVKRKLHRGGGGRLILEMVVVMLML